MFIGTHELIVIGFTVLLWILSIWDIFRQKHPVQTLDIAWLLLIIMLPVLGAVLYFFLVSNTRRHKPKKFDPKFRY